MNFSKTGYSIKEVEEQFARMKDISREDLLKYKEKENEVKLKFTKITKIGKYYQRMKNKQRSLKKNQSSHSNGTKI